MPKKKPLKVVELFAGVGGFRLGLEGFMIDEQYKSPFSRYEKPMDKNFEVIWSNQWEPLTPTKQHANWVYKKNWPNSNHNEKNIEEIIKNTPEEIPDHDVLVGDRKSVV